MTQPPGMRGRCKVCSSKWLPEINQHLDAGWNAREIISWIEEASKGQLTLVRQTLYPHRDNVGGLHKRGVTAKSNSSPQSAGSSAPRDPGSPAPKSSNDEFLEFVRDHGMADLRENPHYISPKMAMEAVKILEARKTIQTNVLILARVLTNQIEAPASNPEIVVSDYREIIAPPEPEPLLIAATSEEGAKVQ